MVHVGGEDVGVMMGWETDIMRETVQKMCNPHPNASHLKVLNVGFGLGIVRNLFTLFLFPLMGAHPGRRVFPKSAQSS